MYYAHNTLWRRIKCKSIAPPLLNSYMTSSIWKSRISSPGDHMSYRNCLPMYRPISQSTVGHIWVATSVECWWWVGQGLVDIGRYIDSHVERQSTEVDPCRWSVGEVTTNHRPTVDWWSVATNSRSRLDPPRLDQRPLHRYSDRYVNRKSTEMSADTSVGNSTLQKKYKWKIF